MAARAPRKLFASPFVITLAACGPQSQPAQPQPQNDPNIIANPPEPTTPPEPTPTPPPPPESTNNANTVEQRWTVMKNDSACRAVQKVNCPQPKHPGDPVPTCNPPAPMKIECPAGWDGKSPMTVVKYANQTECMIEPPKVSEADCPKATCNPPPPRKIACPTWR